MKKIVEKVLIDFFEIGKKFLWAEKTWEGILDELKTLLLELLCNKLFWRFSRYGWGSSNSWLHVHSKVLAV